MSVMNIAMLGGVVLLLLLLIRIRRGRADEAAPAASWGEAALGMAAPPPAAAAAVSTRAATTAPPLAPAPPRPHDPPHAAEGGIVTDPGWPLPGEISGGWEPGGFDAAAGWTPPAAADAPGHDIIGSGDALPGGPPDLGAGPAPAAGIGSPDAPPFTAAPEPEALEETPPAPDVADAVAAGDPIGAEPWIPPTAADPEAPAWPPAGDDAGAPPVTAAADEPSWPVPVALPDLDDGSSPWSGADPAGAGSPWEPSEETTGRVEIPPEVAAAAAPDVPWWDEDVPGAGRADDDAESRTGRFAVGGVALAAGHHAVAGVGFRRELPEPPRSWSLGPAEDAAPGTLVLHLDGAINCGADDVEVLVDEGFAPTPDGFVLKVAARCPGPFAAGGTFRVV